MKISVIIATWNRAPRLVAALDSVYRQTLPPHEIILVDDGSDDGTRELVSGRYAGVRYHYQENRGVSSARNTGIRMATGDWIALLDSDDAWLPRKLEWQRLAVQRQPAFRICHTNEIWIRNGKRVNPMKKHAKQGGRIFRHCLPRCVISPSAVLIHREVLAHRRFDETLPACEDYELWLHLCAAHPVLYLEEPLVIKHGGHHDQLSRRYWGMDRFRVRALEKLIRSADLSKEDLCAALQVLLDKIAIIHRGAVKRGNTELAREYRNKQLCYRTILDSSHDSPGGVMRQSGWLAS
jgi:glycosyltransferase involved in cell wall biosynthesis